MQQLLRGLHTDVELTAIWEQSLIIVGPKEHWHSIVVAALQQFQWLLTLLDHLPGTRALAAGHVSTKSKLSSRMKLLSLKESALVVNVPVWQNRQQPTVLMHDF